MGTQYKGWPGMRHGSKNRGARKEKESFHLGKRTGSLDIRGKNSLKKRKRSSSKPGKDNKVINSRGRQGHSSVIRLFWALKLRFKRETGFLEGFGRVIGLGGKGEQG